MKISTSLFLAAGLLLSASLTAAPPPAATRAAPAPATRPCPMGGPGMMGNANCPGMQGGMMQGGRMGPGMMANGACSGMSGNAPCPAMQGGGKPRMPLCPGAQPGKPCPGVPGAATYSSPAVFGWQLMTPGEREAYWTKMRAAKTPEDRAKLRAEHHKEMLERARKQGVTLPEVPPSAATGG